jgi:hypothetical protein
MRCGERRGLGQRDRGIVKLGESRRSNKGASGVLSRARGTMRGLGYAYFITLCLAHSLLISSKVRGSYRLMRV